MSSSRSFPVKLCVGRRFYDRRKRGRYTHTVKRADVIRSMITKSDCDYISLGNLE
jgi:Pyruvate/2-oxoacid:ferredoxin oxidoreductase gamma subunit